MQDQLFFARFELKYLITIKQYDLVRLAMQHDLVGDAYGRCTVCNIYYDTPTFLLARRSIGKPVYKEKLRIRSYGVAAPDGKVFVEIKKKCDHVVYKRRIATTEADAGAWLSSAQVHPTANQITSEIDYFRDHYPDLQPRCFLSYHREAYLSRSDPGLRITFDNNISWRTDNLSLCLGSGGQQLLAEDQVLMEIKSPGAIPLWLIHFLTENKIYQTSFSKYGLAYQQYYLKGDHNRCLTQFLQEYSPVPVVDRSVQQTFSPAWRPRC